jgi:hypothetical protein
MPSSPKNVFSVTRSCETPSASGGGYTGKRAATTRAAVIGTFSNSYVTMSTSFVSRSIAARSSAEATMSSPTPRTDSPPGSTNTNS